MFAAPTVNPPHPKSRTFVALPNLISIFRHIRASVDVRRYAEQHGTVQSRNPLRRFRVPSYSLVTPTEPYYPQKARNTETSVVNHSVPANSLRILTFRHRASCI